jgi:small subunit ribosomal protein S4
MGDIKKIRKKYSKPSHPWRIARIEEENAICKEYGIPKKNELWKGIAKLESFKNQAKKFSALQGSQADLERNNLFKKLHSYNLINVGDSADAILGITLKNILDRRLQTLVFKKGLTKTMKQARQMITHRHVSINNKIVSSPSYIVKVVEEASMSIRPKSPFYNQDHAERIKEPSKRKPKPKMPDKFRSRRK